MTAAITAAVVGGVIGAGTAAYSADQQKKAAEESANNWNAMTQGAMDLDREAQQWDRDMWRYGNIDGWTTYDGKEVRTTPYSSSEREGSGYYIHKDGTVWDKAHYDKTSRSGKKALEKYGNLTWVPVTRNDTQYEWGMEDGSTPYYMASGPNASDGKGVLYDAAGRALSQAEAAGVSAADIAAGKYTWKPATAKENDNSSQYALEKQQLAYQNDLFPRAAEYTDKSLAAATELIDPNKNAALAEANYTIDTKPEQAKADIAGYQYTQQAMPEKWNLVQTMSGLAQRNTESEAARMAGAEVAQAYNTKQQTLADNIRRTGAVAGSGRMAGLQEDLDMNRVKDTAGARVAARNNARTSQYDMLSRAVQLI